MLFSDITDCEMLVYRCIQEADNEIGLVGIMDELEKKYQKDWFISMARPPVHFPLKRMMRTR